MHWYKDVAPSLQFYLHRHTFSLCNEGSFQKLWTLERLSCKITDSTIGSARNSFPDTWLSNCNGAGVLSVVQQLYSLLRVHYHEFSALMPFWILLTVCFSGWTQTRASQSAWRRPSSSAFNAAVRSSPGSEYSLFNCEPNRFHLTNKPLIIPLSEFIYFGRCLTRWKEKKRIRKRTAQPSFSFPFTIFFVTETLSSSSFLQQCRYWGRPGVQICNQLDGVKCQDDQEYFLEKC